MFSDPDKSYLTQRQEYWDQVARDSDTWRSWGEYYHKRLGDIYQFLVPSGQRVLELGCGQGDLLARLLPSEGVGVDFSGEMVRRATQRHPELQFVHADAHCLTLDYAFDVIILSDLLNDLWDVQTVLNQLKPLCHSRTRIIFNLYSRLWELPLAFAAALRLAKPTLRQNWLTVEDIRTLLALTDFEVIRRWEEILFPLPIPILAPISNQYLVKTWPFRHAALTNFLVARPNANVRRQSSKPTVSVIIPARNESGNVKSIISRTPEMGGGTELIFVEGHSKDDTYEVLETTISAHPERNCKLFRQIGVGKGDAVRLGFDKANGDILMILDADMTMPPEDLPRFYDALNENKAEFVNGVRLVYPMEKQAMRFVNLVGNKFFGLAFSWLMGQSIKDTLCGTKCLWRLDYEVISANRSYFGDFDPFGDFDLLFGAARLGLKILDLPIRYRERTFGETNIQRWKHGWLLIRMVFFAALRLKFV